MFRSPVTIVLISSTLFFSKSWSRSLKKISILPSGDLYITNICIVFLFSFIFIPAHSMSISIHFGPCMIVSTLFSAILSLTYIAVPPCIFLVLLKCVIKLYPFIFMVSSALNNCQCSVMQSTSGFSIVFRFSNIGTLLFMHCMFWWIILNEYSSSLPLLLVL
uniref:Uncharacterized protein n=1 Tax=Cacopsylla melanoneura TaxID=428564 RepID=A0A8D8VU75_9HEMI